MSGPAIHDAAEAGAAERVAELLHSDPSLVHAKGRDGCTPLHLAPNVVTAQLLLDHGARIDARDEDHDSTPAQWRISEAPELARYLLGRGATPDIFLAAALGDLDLVTALVARNPGCVAYRIGRLPDF